jgi:hypothetical protein
MSDIIERIGIPFADPKPIVRRAFRSLALEPADGGGGAPKLGEPSTPTEGEVRSSETSGR